MLFDPSSGLGHLQSEIQQLEHKISGKADQHDVSQTHSDVVRMEHTMREACAEIARLRDRLETLEQKIVDLEIQ